MRTNLLLFVTLTCLLSSPTLIAQQQLWGTAIDNLSASYLASQAGVSAGKYKLSKIDLTQLKNILSSAPLEKNDRKYTAGITFSIPMPDETLLTTSVTESPVWETKYATQFSHVKTYLLTDPVTKTSQGRITVTGKGISGIIFSDKGTVYMNPVPAADAGTHISYFVKDDRMPMVQCGSKAEVSTVNTASRPAAGDGNRRTYRLAVAATAEYTAWAGGQDNARDYITISMNNVIAIYERDLNITFTINAPNSIIFTDAGTDPYPGGNVFLDDAATNANQVALDNIIGTANYEFGIVFNNGWDRGYVPVPFGFVCDPANKGKAAAGVSAGTGLNPLAGPQGQAFDFTVAHELGHMFGATHSYASSVGTCAGFATPAAAFEPGGGSTIMSYGGYANCNSYVSYPDHYFHAGSIAQIVSYINSAGNCVTPVSTGNTPPVVAVPATFYNVPVSTPFTLTATGSDADGNTLRYNWEEMDANLLTPSPPAATNTAGPNFRSYPPATTGNVRTFPRMYDIVAGVSPPYEVLPSVTRTMNFRITARDQASPGGATSEADVALNFTSAAGPFTVTSQSSPVTWVANSSQTITWNVAATNIAPVNCTTVDILLSADGGITYPYTLVSNTGNDGSEIITVPNLPVLAGRVKIQSVNNVFFNINAANIIITSTCVAEGTTFAPSDSISAPAGSSSLNLTLSPQYGTPFTPSGTISSANPSTFVIMYNTSVLSCAAYGFNGSFKYAVHPFVVTTPGTYTFTPSTYGLVYNLYYESFNPVFPCYNFIASNTTTGVNPTAIGPTVSAALTPGRRYVLVAGTFSNIFPVLPHTYSVPVTGGSIYADAPDPGASFSYLYVVVDRGTNLIKSIAPTADLSNSAGYPAGTGYTIYGLSYSNSSPSLSSFINSDFNTLTNALLYNASYCGNLSKGFSRVTVLSSPVPLLLSDFYGERNKAFNDLFIEVQSVTGNMKIVVERSADSRSYDSIGSFELQTQNTFAKHKYEDAAPINGNNYYRLKMINQDGSYGYSKVILLKNTQGQQVLVYPNPATDFVTVDMSYLERGRYRLTITDVAGRKLYQSQHNNTVINVPLAGHPAGSYFLQVTDSRQNVLLMKKIVILKK